MAFCTATTKAGHRCKNNSRPGSNFCGRHDRDEVVVDHVCQVRKTNGHVCGKHAPSTFENRWMCNLHYTVRVRHIYNQNAIDIWTELRTAYWNNEVTLEDMEEEVEIAYEDNVLNLNGFRLLMRSIEGIRMLQQNPVPEPVEEGLARLATDPQSVHTTVVTQQTNRAMEVLLSQPVPDGHDTLAQLPVTFRKDKRLYRDMQRWYKQSFCKDVDDWLYRKTLDGLWCLIQTHPEKEELIRRLYEEAGESVSMCCEGHLSRLCNVMVGFDDRFEPPIPVGEILQQKIANIANDDISVEEKVEHAVAVFRELQIPMEEWDVWVDAF